MHHAVSGWTPKCTAGESRIFTIEQKGKPFATGEIIPEGEQWVVKQVKGFHNANPPQDAFNIMDEVALEYTRLQNEGKRQEDEQRLWEKDQLSSVHADPDEE